MVFARQFSGMGSSQIAGYAKNIKTNSTVPTVGAVIKLNMSIYGHLGVVLSYDDKMVVYTDSNGQWTQRVAIRTIPLDDPRIMGYLTN